MSGVIKFTVEVKRESGKEFSKEEATKALMKKRKNVVKVKEQKEEDGICVVVDFDDIVEDEDEEYIDAKLLKKEKNALAKEVRILKEELERYKKLKETVELSVNRLKQQKQTLDDAINPPSQ